MKYLKESKDPRGSKSCELQLAPTTRIRQSYVLFTPYVVGPTSSLLPKLQGLLRIHNFTPSTKRLKMLYHLTPCQTHLHQSHSIFDCFEKDDDKFEGCEGQS